MKKRVTLLLAICLLSGIFMGCQNTAKDTAQKSEAEESGKEEIFRTVYPTGFETYMDISKVESPPDIIFTTPASENGLGDTLYKFEGEVTKIVPAEEAVGGYAHFIITSEQGEMIILDSVTAIAALNQEDVDFVDVADLSEALRHYFPIPQLGEQVCVYANYSGFSNVYKKATSDYGGIAYLEDMCAQIMADSETDRIMKEKMEQIYPAQDEDAQDAPPAEVEQEAPQPPKPTVTMGQKNALKKADSYLNVFSFSYQGLIEQLEFDGFSTEESTYGADYCGADWNEQAAEKAQSYIDLMAFSRSGLKDQLLFDGFTEEQAEYGVTAVGY